MDRVKEPAKSEILLHTSNQETYHDADILVFVQEFTQMFVVPTQIPNRLHVPQIISAPIGNHIRAPEPKSQIQDRGAIFHSTVHPDRLPEFGLSMTAPFVSSPSCVVRIAWSENTRLEILEASSF
jgi:hypothetical protein